MSAVTAVAADAGSRARNDAGYFPTRTNDVAEGSTPFGLVLTVPEWLKFGLCSRVWPVCRTADRPLDFTVIDGCRNTDGRIAEYWGVPDRFAVLA
jgi:hypothetical protein